MVLKGPKLMRTILGLSIYPIAYWAWIKQI